MALKLFWVSTIMIGAYPTLDEQKEFFMDNLDGFVHILIRSDTKLDLKIERLFPERTERPKIDFR